ncbi:helix-turn-helix domain-containing protein [Sulfitobacter mediterraneus]|uniref:cyclic nucleotide-binding domain-containing protein n=1 Tax=Sulfitobacter mediterraneus TaxID=83219 RepID=UPI00193359A9|nr:cyclic nucleotide-binding domain-containing protein [Sulfitobacter mediterraneus]MBM1310655.1 helix-turn-helix domain-containing protein [Sulfitobacter mediterraneus]MBM1314539.1 helix-turn-helix domain-containing protein [Sulfitobacter mediterraneus]MBM1322899.1 helix-turn-helix domain-containing protein [Sulfitobacter mediterraneus]MBM1326811.1 helix-turn-helix domain-containing protein [Sulfitobacter mediterraneus]MBM1398157.1 helix-turn-helix domain-containing protein [Sulfitobacter med
MNESETTDIRSLPIFAEMADENFESLMRGSYVQNFPPQIELISEGEPSDFLHVIISGAVELFASWNDRESTMAIVRPVSTFILAATIKDAPYLMSARTLEKSRIVLLPSTDVRQIYDIDNGFSRALVTELAQCYRGVVKNSKDLKLRTSIERLANYLLKQHSRANGNGAFELNIEKRKIASQMGMTPENLSRAIKALKPYGVTVNGTSVHIADADDLASLAKPDPLIDDPLS